MLAVEGTLLLFLFSLVHTLYQFAFKITTLAALGIAADTPQSRYGVTRSMSGKPDHAEAWRRRGNAQKNRHRKQIGIRALCNKKSTNK